MKKLIVLFITCFFILSTCSALAVDLSSMSFSELLELQEEVSKALWASDEFQEVTVPVGLYEVGKEIPAGKWTLKKASDEFTYFRLANKFSNGDIHDFAFYSDLEEESTIVAVEGQYIQISEHPVIFSTYVQTFSFK